MRSLKKIFVSLSLLFVLFSLSGCAYFTYHEEMWVTKESVRSYEENIEKIYGAAAVDDYTVSYNRHKVIPLTTQEYNDFCRFYRYYDSERYWSESDVYDQLRDFGLGRNQADNAAEEFFNARHCLLVVSLTYNPGMVMVFLK